MFQAPVTTHYSLAVRLFAASIVILGSGLQVLAQNTPRVAINEDGVLLVNGRKILPIGFSNGPPTDGRTNAGRQTRIR